MLSLPFNPFSGLTAKIYGGIAIAAITFGAVQTVRIEGLRIWPLKIEGYAAANARLTAEKAAYIAAQREAEAKAIAAKLAQEAKDEQRRKTADEHLKQDLADDRRRTDDYARRMRYQAPRSAPSGTDLPSGTEAPQVADRSSDVAELVGITRTDLEICTVNSRRLLNAHDWAVGE